MVKIDISEIFGPTIQGEGSQIGKPTVFIRTGGCDYQCSWCDTLYAVQEKYRKDWTPMTAKEIMKEVRRLGGDKPLLITLSGGNPAMQDLSELIEMGQSYGYEFAIETQGSISAEWFDKLDYVVFSPKPPSSLMTTDWEKLDDCYDQVLDKSKVSFKVVVSDERDYIFAKKVFTRFPKCSQYITPCNISPGDPDIEAINDKMRYVSDMILKDELYDVTITPQLHVLLYGNQRGV